jgi:osmotically-inducible protein OsmY
MNIQANTKSASLLSILTGLALIGALVLGAGAAFADNMKSDHSTLLNVKLALLNKLGTDSLRIDVDAAGGNVTLKGMVHKRETKELAETVAKSVAGVKMVDNDLTLASAGANPSKTDAVTKEAEAELKDAVLETKVRIALVDKLGGDGFDISTQVASGVVTLAFHKDFVAAHRTEAQNIVKGVEGVTKVVVVDQKS